MKKLFVYVVVLPILTVLFVFTPISLLRIVPLALGIENELACWVLAALIYLPVLLVAWRIRRRKKRLRQWEWDGVTRGGGGPN